MTKHQLGHLRLMTISKHVMISKISPADKGSGLETDARQRRAERRYEDEKKLRADSPAISNYMLKRSIRDWEEGAGTDQRTIGHNGVEANTRSRGRIRLIRRYKGRK
jgi:hypothetical protein